MTKERAWPARAMYILIAAALAMSLIILAAPAPKVSADPGLSKWTRVDTPTTDGWVLAPESIIIDYALAEAGEVAYAVVDSYYGDLEGDYFLLKSDDYAATWTDLTSKLDKVDDGETIGEIVQVATDWVDPDFVAVAVVENGELRVYFSTDGGETFNDAKEVKYGDVYLDMVSDLAVSYESAGKRDIAIGGVEYDDGTGLYAAGLFRCTVDGDSAGNWEDATEYDGWDDDGALDSELVTDIIFSTSWATDKTILVTTVDVEDWDEDMETGDVYVQSGSWGTTAGWNEKSTLGIKAVPIIEGKDLPMWLAYLDARAIAGITLPEDYNSKNSNTRILWVWVNYYDGDDEPTNKIVRVDNADAGTAGPMSQIKGGELWLTNISYKGTIAQGEAIAGVLGTGTHTDSNYYELVTACCEGVDVYHNGAIANMLICCDPWKPACKPPTGRAGMAVSYVGEDKAYAVALQGYDAYDESAWSVSLDDGDTWNQLSLIDTNIDYLSDVAVSPDCNKTMLVSVNVEKVCIEYGQEDGGATCDSVWLHAVNLPEAEEYSGQWIRTWSGQLENDHGLLRLAPEETTGDTVVLVDRMSSNVYWNGLETLACWDPIGSTVLDEIVDLALQDDDTLFALDANGDVAMFDDDEWQKEVDSKVDAGWTIAVWGDHIIVGGEDGDVSYSDDGGETFTLLEDSPTIDGYVTVAFDTYFDQNDVIYAATDENDYTGGIYQWVIGESKKWQDLNAVPEEWQVLPETMWTTPDGTAEVEVAYTGLVVDRPGNPFTDAENGGVIYASYVGYWNGYYFTGAARSLERTVTVCSTCLDWDFLHVGLTVDQELFEAWPDALKICGCLTPDSDTKLFAIDSWSDYDMEDGEDGAVWTFEDCYAKKAPEITSPADGTVIPADPCSCYSIPFTVLWGPLCDSCSYDIEFAMDEEFTMPVKVNGEDDTTYHLEEKDVPAFSILGGALGGLSCEMTYYVRVRAADAATGQIIHSWWSDPRKVTIAPAEGSGVTLPDRTGEEVPTTNAAFTWSEVASADEYDFVLSANADLSSPIVEAKGLTTTVYTYTGTLDHGTTYYYQVNALKDGVVINTSPIGTFTTVEAAEYCHPETGRCFDTPEELEEYSQELREQSMKTPMWVWIVIAIGAVLVIVVIVLIFRTRRV